MAAVYHNGLFLVREFTMDLVQCFQRWLRPWRATILVQPRSMIHGRMA
jgi:hypothetical protein